MLVLSVCLVIGMTIAEPRIGRCFESRDVVDAHMCEVRLIGLQISVLDFGESKICLKWIHPACQIQISLPQNPFGSGCHRGWLPRNQDVRACTLIADKLRVWIKREYGIKTATLERNIYFGWPLAAISENSRDCGSLPKLEIGNFDVTSDPRSIDCNHVSVGFFGSRGESGGLPYTVPHFSGLCARSFGEISGLNGLSDRLLGECVGILHSTSSSCFDQRLMSSFGCILGCICGSLGNGSLPDANHSADESASNQ